MSKAWKIPQMAEADRKDDHLGVEGTRSRETRHLGGHETGYHMGNWAT